MEQQNVTTTDDAQVQGRRDAPVVAVVLAAGSGLRFDPDNPKQLVAIDGKPIVGWSIDAFERNARVSDIIVVVNAQVRAAIEQLIRDGGATKVRAVIDGGTERADSTAAALDTLSAAGVPGDAKILIHDSVRPFVMQSQIDGCIDALEEFDAATVACPSTDTILLTEDLGDRQAVKSVPERRHSYRAQTPQAFRFATIHEAYALASDDSDFRPTDDTRVVVDYLPDTPVAIVGGSPLNMKVTTRDDMPFATLIAGEITKAAAKQQVHTMFQQALS